MITKKILIDFIILIGCWVSLIAGDFTASVDRNPVSTGEQFQVTFSLNNSKGSNFRPPSFTGFKVLMGPSTQQSMSIINGHQSSSTGYTYVLLADKVGKYTIGAASIQADGKVLQSNSITVNVVKNSGQSTKQQQQQRQQQTGRAGQQQQGNFKQQASDYIKDKIFIRVSVSKRSVVIGEQLVATYKIFFNPNLQLLGANSSKEPQFTGFWSQSMDMTNSPTTTEVVNGVRYSTKEVKKIVLVPQQKGELVIEPLEIEFVVALPVSNGWFTDYERYNQKISSTREKINVSSLPDNGKPNGYSGAVGNLKFNATLDKHETRTNEPVTLKIQISGSGNLKLIEPFILQLPQGIESFEPKISDNSSVSSGGMSGSKTFEYLLIPRNAGEFRIPPVEFSYFDPAKNKYEKLSSEEFTLKVEKGTGAEVASSVKGLSKEEVKYIGQDVRYIKNTLTGLRTRGEQFYGSLEFWISSLFPFGLFLLFLIYKKRRDKLYSDPALMKNRAASKLAKKHLERASKLISTDSPDAFYDELSRALWNYLSGKFNINPADLTRENAREQLILKNISEDKILLVFNILDECEFARYAPSESLRDKQSLCDTAVRVISEMEEGLK